MSVCAIWCRLVAGALMLCFVVPGEAGVVGDDLYLVSVGRGPGANQSQWYTTVWVFNPGPESAEVTVSFLERGRSNLAPDRQTTIIAAGRTVTFPEVLANLFGLNDAAGGLRFESSAPIVVGARIYNLPGADVADSQGQFAAALPARLAVGAGGSTVIPGVTQPASGAFRCSFALLESAGDAAHVRVSLHDGAGAELAVRDYHLRPHEPIQRNLAHLGNGGEVDGGSLHVEVLSGGGRVLAMASMVGNGSTSQDPSTLEAAIECQSDGGGPLPVTEVVAGAGLVGGGSGGQVTLDVAAGDGLEVHGDVIRVAANGVTSGMVADSTVVRGLSVAGETLHDVVTLVGAGAVDIARQGKAVVVAADPRPTSYVLEVTATEGSWDTERAIGVPFELADGSWYLLFNISGVQWSPVDQLILEVDGVVFNATQRYRQAVAVWVERGDVVTAVTEPGTNQIHITTGGSTRRRFAVSGNVELDGRPAWAK